MAQLVGSRMLIVELSRTAHLRPGEGSHTLEGSSFHRDAEGSETPSKRNSVLKVATRRAPVSARRSDPAAPAVGTAQLFPSTTPVAGALNCCFGGAGVVEGSVLPSGGLVVAVGGVVGVDAPPGEVLVQVLTGLRSSCTAVHGIATSPSTFSMSISLASFGETHMSHLSRDMTM